MRKMKNGTGEGPTKNTEKDGGKVEEQSGHL